MIDFGEQGNGYTLSRDDRLEGLQWALSECEHWSDLNDIRRGAPYRALTKHAGPAAERAAQMFRARWQEIEARDRALDAARRNPGAQAAHSGTEA